jgi:predicted O-methyltransferase YrrM
MQKLIERGESETYDFAFIDCDKPNYDNYYELSLKLIRQNGIIVIDNTLWFGKVLEKDTKDEWTLVIQALNDKIAKDSRVIAVQLNIADGLTIVLKK